MAAVLALTAGVAPSLGAQEWNEQRALDLVDRARQTRHATSVDPSFTSYQAQARGFVYFFLDRTDSGEQSLIKADQIALELYWRAPRQTKQHIVGLRDEKLLPTNIRYHLDHLTVVQDDFGDRIRLGDGDEVSGVTHPVAPGAERSYDYRIVDSLTLVLPATADTVRVYQLQVRPKEPSLAGFVGTLFLDRESAAIVRMSFTFTPASYIDPYLDYIRISLENGLWEGAHWLPRRQEVELRRELPALDFLAGSVIRGRFEIGPYELNPALSPSLFQSPLVGSVPEAERRNFPFEEPLFSHLEEEGLTTPPTLAEVEDEARQILIDQRLSGLRKLRLHLPSASSAYRYGRAEGSFAGLGSRFEPRDDWSLRIQGGYAFGRERPSAALRLLNGTRAPLADGSLRLELELFSQQLRDLGPFPGASGVVNTLGAALADEDWMDPFFASGARLRLARLPGGLTASIGWERQRSAHDVTSADGTSFRPVRPIREGNLTTLELALAWPGDIPAESGWGGEVRVMQGLLDDTSLRRTLVSATWARAGAWRDFDASLRIDAGHLAASGPAPPAQFVFLLGGRETLLGHPYRSIGGDTFWLLRAELAQRLWGNWVTGRLFAAAGQATLDGGALPTAWEDLDSSAGVLFSLGGGIGLLWDVIHLDLGHGLGGTPSAGWDAAVSVTRRFRAWL